MKLSVCTLLVLIFTSAWVRSQTLNLFDTNDDAISQTQFLNGQAFIFASDDWSGTYNLGVTGMTSGGSSLPNPGRESSGSGAFFADHQFGLTSWNLSGWAQGTIDAGLGNTGTTFPTIASTTILGSSLYFFVDQPFTLRLTGEVSNRLSGNGTNPGNSGATVRLFAEILDGVLVNQYIADWSTFQGDTGGSFTDTFNSGVFRLEVQATALLSSNIPQAIQEKYSSYNAQLNIQPIPEPSSALLLATAALGPLLRRKRSHRPGKTLPADV